MAKKDKQPKYTTEAVEPTAEAIQASAEANAAILEAAPVEAGTTEAAPLIPRNPSLYLQDEAGVQFKFDRRELPRKAAVVGQIVIDGVNSPFQVTSNKGWTLDDTVIEYIWITLPKAADAPEGEKPVTGYISLDYMVQATTFQDKVFTVGAGTANRENPARVPKSEQAEIDRKAAAAKTLADKKAAAEKAAAEQAAAEAEAGTEAAQAEVQV